MIQARRILAPAVIAFLIAGCAGKTPQSTDAQTTEGPEPWFCQPGVEAGDWECVRSAELAQRPVPTRAPVVEPSRPSSPAGTQSTSPVTLPATSIDDEADRATSASERRTAPAGRPPQVTPQPQHVRLAYQPDRPVSLLDLPEDFWVAQLVALSSPEDLEQYAVEHGMQGMSAARVLSGDTLYYVLLLGIYETRDIAEQAIADLPAPFDTHRPWLRTVGSLQQAIRQADAHTMQ